MLKGWMPGVRRYPSNRFGYPNGTQGQNRPEVIVQHTMVGWLRTMEQQPNVWGLTHFGVGLDGRIAQFISVYDAAYGQGITGHIPGYDRTNPILAAWEAAGLWVPVQTPWGQRWCLAQRAGGLPLANTRAVSIEREDGGDPNAPYTQAQMAAIAEVIAWVRADVAKVLGYTI